MVKGCCCLQVTMQAASDRESRFLHDQLAVLAPLFLALSASTPIHKGTLAATDTRWDAISQAVDDRTPAESGRAESPYQLQPDGELVGKGIRRLQKSRYSSVSRFIGKPRNAEELADLDALNDIEADIDPEAMKLLMQQEGIDVNLAKHIAHLFIRDPLVIFDDAIYLNDDKAMDHFENIQSTNWRTIRWKTPSLDIGFEAQKRKGDRSLLKRFSILKSSTENVFSDSGGPLNEAGEADTIDYNSFGPGWRVEFRPLEIQLTDFENAAFALVIVLLARSVLAMGYNFYIPMSLVEENMKRAQVKDAVLNQKFFFRKQTFEGLKDPEDSQRLVPKADDVQVVELTLDEIINGNDGVFGVLPAIEKYLESLGTNSSVLESLKKYFRLISERASGRLPTAAHWMRSFVKNHPSYRHDGLVPFDVAKDLMKLCDDIGMGRVQRPDLLGDLKVTSSIEFVIERFILMSLRWIDCVLKKRWKRI